MRHRTKSVLSVLGSLAIVLTLTGCAGHSWQFWKKSSSTETPAAPTASGEPATTPTTSVTATPAPAAETTATPVAAPGFAELAALADVRFKPGLVTVGKADAATLDGVARWLKANPGATVRIEGHTDDVGSPVDNLAIGQKRAASVMKSLIAKGIDAERISIISYGSDRPVCAEKTDSCRAQNRRAHFLVKQP
jgi:peptidoglycan-associated lipoprotein